ncbi:uncharacterized protein LOC101221594 [Cucumis sativus]|uniref:Uncharacterized protein n=1 Tax=Cucumis sativus TaxID=3659 RepID=A0A0A0KR57_CUCSA|nr:uncharacterized protein LOC101221594 [Cucumis sativus]KGN52073.1 hypothetical protein Csa_007819 [Cucumis sativus]
MENQNSKKRDRDDSAESETGSPEVKRLRDDLLGFFDDSDPEPPTQDLDSLMRSFEEEIATASSSPVPVVDLTADSADSQPELGYLLEASDDELGLPPSNSQQDFARISTDSSDIGEMWRFVDQIPNYDAFELEGGDVYSGSDTAEYVAFDGLLEYSNLCFDASDNSDFLWRQESLPAQ